MAEETNAPENPLTLPATDPVQTEPPPAPDEEVQLAAIEEGLPAPTGTPGNTAAVSTEADGQEESDAVNIEQTPIDPSTGEVKTLSSSSRVGGDRSLMESEYEYQSSTTPEASYNWSSISDSFFALEASPLESTATATVASPTFEEYESEAIDVAASESVATSGTESVETTTPEVAETPDPDQILTGGFAADTLTGGSGNDTIRGEFGRDTLDGNAGDDTIDGGWDIDTLRGGDGNDILTGGLGAYADTLEGGEGDDRMEGGDGNDIYVIGTADLAGQDTIVDTAGFDTIRFDGIDPFATIETVARDGGDMVFTFEAGGSLRISGFFSGNAVEKLEGGGNTYSIEADPGAGMTFADFMASIEDKIIDGTAGADTLSGANGNDLIKGFAGDDAIDGGAGSDTLYGGDGIDTIRGGAGIDTLYGENGNDTLDGGDDADTLDGGWGNDVLHGDGGDDTLKGNFDKDTLYGGDGNDSLYGDFGADTLNGDAGDDMLDGGWDADILKGGDGNDTLKGGLGTFGDTLEGGAGSDSLQGGDGDDLYIFGDDALADDDVITDSAGFDTIRFDGVDPMTAVSNVLRDGNDLIFEYQAGGSLRMTGFYPDITIEKMEFGGNIYSLNGDPGAGMTFADFMASIDDQILEGTTGIDSLTGGIGDDLIKGFAGNDTLDGADGNDTIYGGDGLDAINGGIGADTLLGENGDDTIHGGEGDDSINGGWSNDTLYGDAGNDTIRGDFHNDILYGGDGDDILYGDANNDTLYGDAGDDTLDGGWNPDTMTGGDGNDTFVVRRMSGADTITDFATSGSGAAFADKIAITGFGLSDFSALSISDTIDGNALINLGGGDTLTLIGVQTVDLQAADFLFQ
ncbi:MAG: hypothetical protein OQJ87_04325 [Rhodospirillales bacterium]|nr:hypothetical protein [Rhodospirillales bacterium]